MIIALQPLLPSGDRAIVATMTGFSNDDESHTGKEVVKEPTLEHWQQPQKYGLGTQDKYEDPAPDTGHGRRLPFGLSTLVYTCLVAVITAVIVGAAVGGGVGGGLMNTSKTR